MTLGDLNITQILPDYIGLIIVTLELISCWKDPRVIRMSVSLSDTISAIEHCRRKEVRNTDLPLLA